MRNVFCPQYNVCLTEAAFDESQPKSWDCGGCPDEYSRIDPGCITLAEVAACHMLLWAMFNPKSWRRRSV